MEYYNLLYTSSNNRTRTLGTEYTIFKSQTKKKDEKITNEKIKEPETKKAKCENNVEKTDTGEITVTHRESDDNQPKQRDEECSNQIEQQPDNTESKEDEGISDSTVQQHDGEEGAEQ